LGDLSVEPLLANKAALLRSFALQQSKLKPRTMQIKFVFSFYVDEGQI
jgi:hypothetical protein